MKLNPYFQIGLDVSGRSCLIIGGGTEAEDKAGRLLDAGADLKVVSPELTPRLREWAAGGRFTYLQRCFRPADLEDAFLVLNTVGSNPDLTRRVHALASDRGCLINSYDSPVFSNFGMVALVHPGHLRLSISTSNASPALAGLLRRNLEELFDEEFVEYLEQLARARQRVKTLVPESARRADLLRALVRDFRLEGHLRYPPHWREQVTALLTCDLERCGTRERCASCPLPPPLPAER